MCPNGHFCAAFAGFAGSLCPNSDLLTVIESMSGLWVQGFSGGISSPACKA